MVKARYVSPEKGARGALQFSFQDVVLLRTARSLMNARISPRRIGEALRRVRTQLPAQAPARGFSVAAVGGRVVVHEAGNVRDAGTGQLLFALEVAPGGEVQMLANPAAAAAPPAAEDECSRQFEAALEMEDQDVDAAMQAYQACVARHAHTPARTNLGRLLHLQGRISEAVKMYREAESQDADLLYNLGVALEDLDNAQEAIAAYEGAVAQEPDHMDAHHNLARLWQQAGDQRRALRHWNAYRRLSRGTQS